MQKDLRQPILLRADLVLEWRPISGEGLTTKLLKKWIGPLEVVKQSSSVNYRVEILMGKKKSYVVHVERLKRYHERADEELLCSETEPNGDYTSQKESECFLRIISGENELENSDVTEEYIGSEDVDRNY